MLEIISTTPRTDGTCDVLFVLDGNTEQWVGVPVEIANVPVYLEAFVVESRQAQPELPGVI